MDFLLLAGGLLTTVREGNGEMCGWFIVELPKAVISLTAGLPTTGSSFPTLSSEGA